MKNFRRSSKVDIALLLALGSVAIEQHFSAKDLERVAASAALAEVSLAFGPDRHVTPVHGQVAVFDTLRSIADGRRQAARRRRRGGPHNEVVGGRGFRASFDDQVCEVKHPLRCALGCPTFSEVA